MSEHSDQWFKHAPDEPEHMSAHGEINAAIVAAFLIGTILTVLVTAILIQKYFKVRVAAIEYEIQEIQADFSPKVQAAREAREGWQNSLSEPRWIDQGNGIVALPLDVAMQQVIDQYN